ncbi:sufurtransferase FdhD [Helicobacter sp. 13S00482-2]|nr:formate dehydrogenase accessory sulfurtransferase FdhD [Helicobacter sp. 13S00482-2]PAF54572.1 sufurtransferase FdhD [Helicobacter sp. 13S00482-2]
MPCIVAYKDSNTFDTKKDIIITEERIALYLNGTKIISTMSIPIDQDAHAVGFLLSEGVIEKIEDITNIHVSDDGLSVFIDSKINEDNISNLYHEKTLTSGCCVGVTGNFEGKITEKFISSQMKISINKIWKLIEEFDSSNELFKLTGCVHQAVLCLENNKYVKSEDVGRHNAIDKVVGKAKLNNLDTSSAILLVSGRLSMEMIMKAGMHDIPIIISRAATTQLGIKTAQMLGITLIGFARDDKLNIYTHPARIVL